MKVWTLLRAIARRLPAPIRDPLKRTYVRLENWLIEPAPQPLPQPSPNIASGGVFAYVPDGAPTELDPKNPFSFVPDEMLRHLDNCFRGDHRNELLQLGLVRQVFSHQRMLHLMSLGAPTRYEGDTAAVAANTIDYNIDGAVTAASLDRPSIMFNVVKAIERVDRNIGKLDALSNDARLARCQVALQARVSCRVQAR